MNTFTPDVSFRAVPVGQLISEQDYQRALSDKFVNERAKNFDVRKVQPVTVSYRDGKYYVINGQHTCAIVRKASNSDKTPVWCMIYSDLEYEDEAEQFGNQRGLMRTLSAVDLFNADVEAKKDYALDILEVLDGMGLKLGTCRYEGSNYICCIEALRNIYNKSGKEGLWHTLTIIKNTWGGISDSFDKRIIVGVHKILKTFTNSEFNERRFTALLSKTGVNAVIRAAEVMVDMPTATRYAIAMANIYNKRLRSENELNISKLC